MTNTQEVKTEKQILEEDQIQAQSIVEKEGPLKEMLVNYVGSVMQPENGEVTVEMVINTLASEFPEFLFVVAKENWIRGYQQAMTDVDQVEAERKLAEPSSESEDGPKEEEKS